MVLEWCWDGVGTVLEWCWNGVGMVRRAATIPAHTSHSPGSSSARPTSAVVVLATRLPATVTHTHTHTHMHTYMHTYTHTHTIIYSHTHMHTHRSAVCSV
jgi:hypothetical protein